MFDKSQDAYVALRSIVAERTNSMCIWVGAGLSRPAGLPLWSQLRKQLIEILERKAASLDENGERLLKEAASAARSASSPWIAFEIVKKALGNPTYYASVRDALQVHANTTVPEAYKRIWQLRPGGMLSLNIDRLATRAFNEVHPATCVAEFNGNQAGPYSHLLQSTNPFIANLHGVLDDSTSWVFTNSELRHLSENNGYLTFIDSCLISRVVIFVGLGVDDIAVGSHFRRLCERGVKHGIHYWFTDRRDISTDQAAENIGIRVIRYRSEGENHDELLEAIDDLRGYVAVEESAPPIVPSIDRGRIQPLPQPQEVASLPGEQIRQLLNQYAYTLLQSCDPAEAEASYREFSESYDSPIFRAWYVSDRAPENVLLGHTISNRIARGSFGQVYRATSPDGRDVAIKVLHQEIRRDDRMMQGFRRGVQSMQILSKHQISGMVPYLASYEIPACVVMEYVDGPNLKEAVESRTIETWDEKIRVALDLASIIRSAHVLPERVLHRDIRPSNIMLRGYYTDPARWQLVVLDFDLSWHRDALGLTVVSDTSPSGFVAPEQALITGRDLTRNALVDSYGLGMTLFYVASRIEPGFAQHKHADWRDVLTNTVARRPCSKWKSLPRRFARLIEWSTKERQESRLDMSQIVGELTRLREALQPTAHVESAELVAEEIAARSVMFNEYKWDRNLLKATYSLATGVQICLIGDEGGRRVRCEVAWTRQDAQDRKKVAKYVIPQSKQATNLLDKAGWTTRILSAHASNCFIEGTVAVNVAMGRLDNLGACIEPVAKLMSLS